MAEDHANLATDVAAKARRLGGPSASNSPSYKLSGGFSGVSPTRTRSEARQRRAGKLPQATRFKIT